MKKSNTGNCEKCGIWQRSLHRDHVVSRSRGGSDLPENIQMICANCHQDKTRLDKTNPPESTRVKMRASSAKRRGERRPATSAANTRRYNWTQEEQDAWNILHPPRRSVISGNCEHCGIYRWSLCRDHKVAKFRGGSDTPDNIQLLCANCHLEKTRIDVTDPPQEVIDRMRAKLIGVPLSESRRANQSKAHKKRYESQEERDLQSARLMGHEVTPATRKKISDSHTGVPQPAAHRENVRIGRNNYVHSCVVAYTQAILEMTLMGYNAIPSTRTFKTAKGKKISETRTGAHLSEEWRENVRIGRNNYVQSCVVAYTQSVLEMTLAFARPLAG